MNHGELYSTRAFRDQAAALHYQDRGLHDYQVLIVEKGRLLSARWWISTLDIMILTVIHDMGDPRNPICEAEAEGCLLRGR